MYFTCGSVRRGLETTLISLILALQVAEKSLSNDNKRYR